MPETSNAILFSDIALSHQLSRAVNDMQYTQATSIQASAIPILMEGRDLIGHSSTGTGKTAAFGIPAVECVEGENKRPQVLVLSPTRELAMQIAREMQKYAKYKEGVCVAAVYGGASMPEQIRQLRRANIVIGTPGRLMDHLRRRTLKMEEIKMVVLDEADEMLSMGFIDDIGAILAKAPEQHQTVLFSATMPKPILEISKKFLHNPEVVDVMRQTASESNIEQTYYYIPQNCKQAALSLLLKANNAQHSIVFCNTKAMVDELAEKLHGQGFKACGIHGDMTQAVRTQVMGRFRTGSVRILVATDVAARGIDVNDIDAVINYDLPQSSEYYVHRIGRTGRAGKQGVSQTLVCNGKQMGVLKGLMRFTGHKIEEHKLPSPEEMQAAEAEKLAQRLITEAHRPGKGAQALVEHLAQEMEPEEMALLLAGALLAKEAGFAAAPAPAAVPRVKAESAGGVRVTANIGRSRNINANHLIGALVEAIDVPSRDIGKIDIREDCSHIQLGEAAAKALLACGKSIRIMGSKVKFTLQNKTARPAYRPRARHT